MSERRDLTRELPRGRTKWVPHEHGFEAGGVRLTPRECDVLELRMLGFTLQRIAAKMWVDYETVHTHVQRLHRKLSTSGPVQMANRARDLGFSPRQSGG